MNVVFRGWARLWKSQDGGSAIEFAFIGTIIIIITIGAFELGRGLWMYNRLVNAVGESTRLTQMQASDDLIISRINSRFSSSEQASLTIIIGTTEKDGVSYRRIEALYNLPLVMPNLGLIFTSPYTMRALQLIPLN